MSWNAMLRLVRWPFIGAVEYRISASRGAIGGAALFDMCRCSWEPAMKVNVLRHTLAAAVASLLLFGAAAARASDATDLAKRAGFLIGHAYRCGAPAPQIKASAAMMDGLIAAYSLNNDDKTAARSEFVEDAASSALAQQVDGPLPECTVVRAQLSRFEQHYLTHEPNSTAQ
jgi:hypothetical protein